MIKATCWRKSLLLLMSPEHAVWQGSIASGGRNRWIITSLAVSTKQNALKVWESYTVQEAILNYMLPPTRLHLLSLPMQCYQLRTKCSKRWAYVVKFLIPSSTVTFGNGPWHDGEIGAGYCSLILVLGQALLHPCLCPLVHSGDKQGDIEFWLFFLF